MPEVQAFQPHAAFAVAFYNVGSAVPNGIVVVDGVVAEDRVAYVLTHAGRSPVGALVYLLRRPVGADELGRYASAHGTLMSHPDVVQVGTVEPPEES